MPGYEWRLQSPITKDFIVAGQETPVQADTVRLLSVHDDHVHGRLFVRFIYGTSANGSFEPAVRDDGLAVSGPNYYDVVREVRLDDESAVLGLCARLCAWTGSMRSIPPPATP